MGYIIEGSVQVPERVERERSFGLNNILNNMSKRSPNGRIILDLFFIGRDFFI